MVIIPESFITKGNNKHPDPTKVFVAAKMVREVEFLGTNKMLKYYFPTSKFSFQTQLTS